MKNIVIVLTVLSLSLFTSCAHKGKKSCCSKKAETAKAKDCGDKKSCDVKKKKCCDYKKSCDVKKKKDNA